MANLIFPTTFFATGLYPFDVELLIVRPESASGQPVLHFYNLVELKFNWRCAPEDDDGCFDPLTLQVEFSNFTGKVGERTAGDTDVIAHLDVDDSFLLSFDSGYC